MALDLGLGVYEETEEDFNEVGLEPLITSTTSVVVEDGPGHEAEAEAGGEAALAGGEPAGWSQPVPPPPPPQAYGAAPAPYESAAPYAGSADVEQAGKLFLGGISWQTDENQLHAYFASFGELVDVAVMRNKATGISRGFGFITYRNPEVVETVLAQDHHLDGRRVDIKRAVPRDRAPPAVDRRAGGAYGPAQPHYAAAPPQQQQQQQQHPGDGLRAYGNGQAANTRKLFVGGIPPTVAEAEFRQYFERFGAVVDAVVMYDRNTLRSRGFGFVTFAEIESARAVLGQQHELQGKFVEVKSAEPKEVMNAQHAAMAAAQHHHHHHPHHGYQQQQQQYDAHAAAMAQQHHYAQGGSSHYGGPSPNMADPYAGQRPDAVYHDARLGPPQQHDYYAPSAYHHDPYHAYQQHYQSQQAQQPQDLNALDQQYVQQRGYDNGQAMGDAYAAYQQQRGMPAAQPYGYSQDNFTGGYRGGAPRNRDRGYRPYN